MNHGITVYVYLGEALHHLIHTNYLIENEIKCSDNMLVLLQYSHAEEVAIKDT